MMIVAIPQYSDDIAPCFEAANHFLISVVEKGSITSSETVTCPECNGLSQCRLMRDQRVDVLICNGIKRIYRDMLSAGGITVITNLTRPVKDALDMFCRGELKPLECSTDSPDYCPGIPLNDLICWAKDLFETSGYMVRTGPALAPYLIDLVAEVICPVCQKPVRVAVCCGAHMYKAVQEVRQFHLIAGDRYDARVYVHPATPELSRCCREYSVELIDPDAEPAETVSKKLRIPLLRSVVPGHEKASGTG